MSRIREQKGFILVNREALQYIYLLFYLSFISPFLFPSWCGYMACFHFKINTCLVIYGSLCESVVISFLSENERSWSVIFSCKSVGCSKKMRCQHRTSWKCYCIGVGLHNKMHMFREYFLSFTTSKITGKVELTKKATCKTSAILCSRDDNCFDTANLYSRTIRPSTKTCVF